MIDSRATTLSGDPTRRAWYWGVLLLGCLAAVGQTPVPPLPPVSPKSESADATADSQTIATELKGLSDPTILKRRVWLETEWDKYDGSTHGVEETLGGLWS